MAGKGGAVVRAAWALAATLVVALLGWPLLRWVALVVGHPDAVAVLFADATHTAAANSALLATGVAAFALVVGAPIGLLLARTRLPAASWWRAAVLVPFAVPPWVLAIAWLDLLNPATGRMLPAFRALGLPAPDVYGPMGMAWVLGLEAVPLVALATADAAGRLDASLEEAARVAGAGPLRALWVATVPLVWPAAASAAATAAAGTLAAWSVPYLLAAGSTEPWPVLATRLVGVLDADPARGLPAAGVLAGLLVVMGLVPLGLARWWAPDRGRVAVGGKGGRRTATVRSPGAMSVLVVWCAVSAALPLAALVAAANGGGGLRRVAARADVVDAVGRSVLLAIGAGVVAAALGALFAWVARRTTWRGRGLVLALARLPWAVPGTALALVLLLGFASEIRWIFADRLTVSLALGNTAWLLLVAYVLRFLALPIGAVDAALSSVDPALEDAAAVAGAGPAARAVRVALPLAAADVLRGGLLVAVAALSEVTLSVLLCGPSTRVVGTVAFDLLSYGDPAAAATLGAGLAAVGILGAVLAQRVGRSAGAWS